MSAFALRGAAAEPGTEPVITLEFDVALGAPTERVFAALTEPALLERWFCDRAASEARAGGRIELGWNGGDAESFAGVWTLFAPFRACAYAGGHPGYPDGDAGIVEFALEPSGEATALIVRHTLPSRPGYETIATRYRSAWPRALARLEALVATPSDREQGT